MHPAEAWCSMNPHQLQSLDLWLLGLQSWTNKFLLILNYPVLLWCSITAVQMARYSIMTIFLLKVKKWERVSYLLEVTQQALVWSGLLTDELCCQSSRRWFSIKEFERGEQGNQVDIQWMYVHKNYGALSLGICAAFRRKPILRKWNNWEGAKREVRL